MDVKEARSENLNDNNEDRFSFQFVYRKRVLWMLLALTVLIKLLYSYF